MEIESLKKDNAPTVEVKSTKERKQIYRELKKEVKQRVKKKHNALEQESYE